MAGTEPEEKRLHGIISRLKNELEVARSEAATSTTEGACEFLARHLESTGEEMLEKNFIKEGEILVSVFCVIGPSAGEMTALIREWASAKGMKRTS